MTYGQAYLSGWKETFNFSGRASRQQFWTFFLINLLIASAPLAVWCDVFCETGVFTPDESVRILEAGVLHGPLAGMGVECRVRSGFAGWTVGECRSTWVS